MRMRKNLLRWALLSSCVLCAGLTACSDDDAEAPRKTQYSVTAFASTTVPATVPAEGGTYSMTFTTRTETRAAAAEPVFEAWQYRITLGDAAGDPVKVVRPTTEVPVVVGANYSKEPRSVVIEMAVAADEATAVQWKKIVEAEQEPSLHDYCVTAFASTTVPAAVPYNGGDYAVTFETSIETRAADPIFVEWQYRITVGDEAGEAVAVSEKTESIDVTIAPNYTEQTRTVTIEMADAGAEPQWRKIVEAAQEPALMQVAGFYWTKGNVTLRDGQFALADKMSETGLYFRNGSKYGVPSDGSYAGTAYTPEPVQIALSDIPHGETNADPCAMIDPSLRTPTHMELYYLIDQEDYTNIHQLDGIDGIGFVGSTYFLPYCGAMELATGQINGRSSLGGYWGLGGNYVGDGVIYVLNEEYSLLDYDLAGLNMASLRCVKNIRQPSYVSHTPASVADNALFTLDIKTDPGDFELYEVGLETADGGLTQTYATDKKTGIDLIVPENDEPVAKEWRLFVNRIYTGISIEQPGLKNYARYVSHTPSEASYEAFTLTVVCESDLASFPVVVKGSDGSEFTGTGSKQNPTVAISVPENTGKERTLAIWVNGVDTKKSLVQEKNTTAKPYSVVWSEGYLTVREGQYVFAEPKQRGMYFKWKSRYGILFEGAVSSSTKYQGTVYGPEEQSIPAYADIPCGDVDPCSLVAPAGTWYMPDGELLSELTADGAKESGDGYRMCSDGSQNIFLAASGQLYRDGSKVMLSNIISVWTATESTTKPGQYSYLMWSTTSATGKPTVSSGGVVPATAMMVRCVRDK